MCGLCVVVGGGGGGGGVVFDNFVMEKNCPDLNGQSQLKKKFDWRRPLTMTKGIREVQY